jgi:hypothetical protein
MNMKYEEDLQHRDGTPFRPLYVGNGGPEYYNLERLKKDLVRIQSIIDENVKKKSVYSARIAKAAEVSWIKQLEGDFPDGISDEYKNNIKDISQGIWPEEMKKAHEKFWSEGMDKEELVLLKRLEETECPYKKRTR